MRRAVFAALLCTLLPACAIGRAVVAGDDDLADYRGFRVAAHEGVRLARAEQYVAAHPKGLWIDEVRQAFDAEEPAYFERSSASRAKTSEYLADLPHGPHAEAAIALLTAFDTHLEDLATEKMMRDARHTEATLDHANVQRHAVGETVLADIAALLDAALYGSPSRALPEATRAALGFGATSTWGRPEPRRSRDLFYSIPTHLARESRIATVKLEILFAGDVAVSGRISGPDLFVHWTEADTVTTLDPTLPEARASSAAHVAEVLTGALEARLPAARCSVPSPGDVIARRCDGWSVIATQADVPGQPDVIVVSGPRK